MNQLCIVVFKENTIRYHELNISLFNTVWLCIDQVDFYIHIFDYVKPGYISVDDPNKEQSVCLISSIRTSLLVYKKKYL